MRCVRAECLRVARRLMAQHRVEDGDVSETRRKGARPASRRGMFSRKINRRRPRVAATARPAAGNVLGSRRLHAATARRRIAAADGAVPLTGQPQRSLVATATRARPRTVGTDSSPAPIDRARVTARSPCRGTRAARAIRVRATRAARAIHGLSGCRLRRRSCGSGQRRAARRGTAAAVMADRVVAGVVRRARNRLRGRVVAAVEDTRAVEVAGAIRAVEAADTAAATADAD